MVADSWWSRLRPHTTLPAACSRAAWAWWSSTASEESLRGDGDGGARGHGEAAELGGGQLRQPFGDIEEALDLGLEVWVGLNALPARTAHQVVQVINEKTGEIVYTLRIKGTKFRPKVFTEDSYTINVGEGTARKSLKGIKAHNKVETLTIKL